MRTVARSIPRVRVRAGVSVVVAGALIGGCASRPASVSEPVSSVRRERSELVFPGEAVRGAALAEAGWERARKDGALNARAGENVYPLDMYPSSAPSLDRYRYLFIPRTPETLIYFSPGDRPGGLVWPY